MSSALYQSPALIYLLSVVLLAMFIGRGPNLVAVSHCAGVELPLCAKGYPETVSVFLRTSS